MDHHPGTGSPSGSVTLSVPAHRDFVAGIRALTRSTAMLCDLTVDDVEDLQIAVDEAATLLLPLVDERGDKQLRADFEVGPGHLRITLVVQRHADTMPDRKGLAWAMLSALDADVSVNADGSDVAIAMSRSRAGAAL